MPAVRDALKNPELWTSRPQDISAVLDALAELETQIPALAKKMELQRVGAGGHSMGSFAAEAIGGATLSLPGRPSVSFADPRVKAILCLSPQGPGQFGLSNESFEQMNLPYLGITGSLDSAGPMANPAWHKQPFERSPEGDKYHALIQGANHMSFISGRTGLSARGDQGKSMFSYTSSASLAFWDAYLKNDASAKRYLQSDALSKSANGKVQLSRR